MKTLVFLVFLVVVGAAAWFLIGKERQDALLTAVKNSAPAKYATAMNPGLDKARAAKDAANRNIHETEGVVNAVEAEAASKN
jgi:hypothetical protein